MLHNAKNGTIEVGNTDMDFASFGKGGKCLLMIPSADVPTL
jgi:hypothetical protein